VIDTLEDRVSIYDIPIVTSNNVPGGTTYLFNGNLVVPTREAFERWRQGRLRMVAWAIRVSVEAPRIERWGRARFVAKKRHGVEQSRWDGNPKRHLKDLTKPAELVREYRRYQNAIYPLDQMVDQRQIVKLGGLS
jgi:hypothetical protein